MTRPTRLTTLVIFGDRFSLRERAHKYQPAGSVCRWVNGLPESYETDSEVVMLRVFTNGDQAAGIRPDYLVIEEVVADPEIYDQLEIMSLTATIKARKE